MRASLFRLLRRATALLRPATRRDVVVEYNPRSNGRPDPGEVVWAWVPYEENASLGKDRPVLIVGRAGS